VCGFAVLVCVVLRGLFMMMFGMKMVAVCDMGVVRSLFVIAGIVMLGCFFVMMRGVLMVFGCSPMMFGRGMSIGHADSPNYKRCGIVSI
jgi:hypothetical protein